MDKLLCSRSQSQFAMELRSELTNLRDPSLVFILQFSRCGILLGNNASSQKVGSFVSILLGEWGGMFHKNKLSNKPTYGVFP